MVTIVVIYELSAIISRLTITPPLPADAQASAQVKGRERYESFVEALGRRLAKGQSLIQDMPEDIQRAAAGISQEHGGDNAA
jgi:hypothetical protein